MRGVECGPVLKSLLDRQLIRIAGHREVPGRPMVYATTRRFLEVFGLGNLKDLPALRELDELAREQGLLPEEEEGAEDALAEEAVEAAEAADADEDDAEEAATGPEIVEPGSAPATDEGPPLSAEELGAASGPEPEIVVAGEPVADDAPEEDEKPDA